MPQWPQIEYHKTKTEFLNCLVKQEQEPKKSFLVEFLLNVSLSNITALLQVS